jgi:hypothetical protein
MPTTPSPQREPRKRIRRRGLADLYSVDIRTIDSWSRRGVIPRPHFVPGSRIPLWFLDEVDRLQTTSAETT